jgi:hypothetical protein
MRGLIAGSLGGCFNPPPALPDAPPDGPRFDSPWGPGDVWDGPKQVVFGPWSPPMPVLTAMGDDDPTLTEDMLEMYFNRSSDIYVAKRATTADPFGTPTRVDELSSTSPETTPEITYDGLTIYFASRRTPTLGVEDIWMATRASRTAAWNTPVHVTELSSSGFDGAATRDANGLAFVLYSDRSGTLEIYESFRNSTANPFPAPTVHSELTSGVGDYDPMLSLDLETIYYDSSMSGVAV